jgi:hypothetical protein
VDMAGELALQIRRHPEVVSDPVGARNPITGSEL